MILVARCNGFGRWTNKVLNLHANNTCISQNLEYTFCRDVLPSNGGSRIPSRSLAATVHRTHTIIHHRSHSPVIYVVSFASLARGVRPRRATTSPSTLLEIMRHVVFKPRRLLPLPLLRMLHTCFLIVRFTRSIHNRFICRLLHLCVHIAAA